VAQDRCRYKSKVGSSRRRLDAWGEDRLDP
jgi:hypothetical protein